MKKACILMLALFWMVSAAAADSLFPSLNSTPDRSGSLFPTLPSPTPAPEPEPTAVPTSAPVPADPGEQTEVCPDCHEGKCMECDGRGSTDCEQCLGLGICGVCFGRPQKYTGWGT